MDYKHSDITEKIIKAYYNVYNALGFGFLEKVYENALEGSDILTRLELIKYIEESIELLPVAEKYW